MRSAPGGDHEESGVTFSSRTMCKAFVSSKQDLAELFTDPSRTSFKLTVDHPLGKVKLSLSKKDSARLRDQLGLSQT